jgi:hypothetical protein
MPRVPLLCALTSNLLLQASQLDAGAQAELQGAMLETAPAPVPTFQGDAPATQVRACTGSGCVTVCAARGCVLQLACVYARLTLAHSVLQLACASPQYCAVCRTGVR